MKCGRWLEPHLIYEPASRILKVLQKMQFVDAKPLVVKFRQGEFQESESGAYFLATIVCAGIIYLLPNSETDTFQFASSVLDLLITIIGILYLKKKNGDTFGNYFLPKYFCFGWITGIRILVLGLPTYLLYWITFKIIVGGDNYQELRDSIFFSVLNIGFYLMVGFLMAATLSQNGEQNSSQNG